MKVSKSYRIFQIINTIIMIIIVAATLYPFLFLVAQSFSSEKAIYNGEVTIFPVGFNIETYKSIIKQGDFLLYYRNTILYAVLGTIISLFSTAILAYPLSKDKLRLNKVITPFVIFTMYFGGGLIPNYVLVNSLGMRNTIWAFLIPGAISTYYVLLMKSFFASLPQELEEAASIDGLGTFGIFIKIVFPLSKPIMATMVLFYAAGLWSNWFTPFIYFDSKDKWPVALYLRQIIYGATSTNEISAGLDQAQSIAASVKSASMVLMALPIICIYPFIQKYFVQGMMIGSVKG
ncbi:carbohydrate ABC transporter permease [Anaeromicropila populeti]|uniref:Putative aldouronate transport system permease protein n=1 Tax=Anaeromicropila populeti TaxID=37658 RepID=A0A1I6JH88_9FIRM|nr:carbohydrate ABC transporter permease [Anaeromicropila populeti]SFR78348.1 putative aldouronate transport system permease protein [Anaeromicropila populeti]